MNKDRTTNRRKPQKIISVTPEFNASEFNFNKVNPDELLFNVTYENEVVTFLVNNSPLTSYHTLLCPSLSDNHSQILTKSSISFAIRFLTSLNERCWRIGYNSPGALASVNHLHLHLMKIDEELYVEGVELILITPGLFKLNPRSGINGFCVEIDDSGVDVKIFEMVQLFCSLNVPHNLFFTFGGRNNRLRVFLYPRATVYETKESCPFNVAFCELSGYVPVGTDEIYESLSEELILERIGSDLGNVIETLEERIVKIFK